MLLVSTSAYFSFGILTSQGDHKRQITFLDCCQYSLSLARSDSSLYNNSFTCCEAYLLFGICLGPPIFSDLIVSVWESWSNAATTPKPIDSYSTMTSLSHIRTSGSMTSLVNRYGFLIELH